MPKQLILAESQKPYPTVEDTEFRFGGGNHSWNPGDVEKCERAYKVEHREQLCAWAFVECL